MQLFVDRTADAIGQIIRLLGSEHRDLRMTANQLVKAMVDHKLAIWLEQPDEHGSTHVGILPTELVAGYACKASIATCTQWAMRPADEARQDALGINNTFTRRLGAIDVTLPRNASA